MLIWGKPPPQSRRDRLASLNDPSTFANPNRPIPVILARDAEEGPEEEDEETEKPAIRAPPPAYGQWRSTVVCLQPVNLL